MVFRHVAVAIAAICLCLTLACGQADTPGSANKTASPTPIDSPQPTVPVVPVVSNPRESTPPPIPTSPPATQLSCSSTPSGPPLALAWPTDSSRTVLVDLSDISNPRTLCTLTNVSSPVRFYSAREIEYVTADSRLVRTDVVTRLSKTYAAEISGYSVWGWSPDGKTLAYWTGARLWLKHEGQAAVALADYKSQLGRGGGSSDQIAILFSPSGTYFVAVNTVTIPLTFEIRRASDGALVWSQPTDVGSSQWTTAAVWSRQSDRLYFRDGGGVRAWDPPGTVTTLVPGLMWSWPSISPTGRQIAYMVYDSKQRVELLDLQTLKVRVISPDRGTSMFASDDVLLYNTTIMGQKDRSFAFDLRTGVETELPFAVLLDVWPR